MDKKMKKYIIALHEKPIQIFKRCVHSIFRTINKCEVNKTIRRLHGLSILKRSEILVTHEDLIKDSKLLNVDNINDVDLETLEMLYL